MSSNSYHEPIELLSQRTIEMHRAIVSLIEELEAVDWYQQRADACKDLELKKILIHHKNEEIEHAIMNLEWIRRRDSVFDEQCRMFLFKEQSITAVEETELSSEKLSTTTSIESKQTNESLDIGSLRLLQDRNEAEDES